MTWTGAADGNWFNAANWSPAQVPTSADDAVIDANGTISVAGTTSLSFATLTLGDSSASFAPTLRISAAESTSGSVVVSSGATIRQDTSQQVGFGSLTVMPGGLLTHTANTTARSYLINLNVTGDFNLEAGAAIQVSSLGYVGGGYNANGFGPGAGYGYTGAAQAGGGGAHGGNGGMAGGSSMGGGTGYDSPTNPTDLGSGGGGGDGSIHGGAGGGAVILSVGGTLTINGAIIANGATGGAGGPTRASGGGAGGTVSLTAAALAGSGVVQASGGAGGPGSYPGGGGGGGRIAVAVSGPDNSSLTLQADNGNGGGASAVNGGSGVIGIASPSGYNLTIGNGKATPQAVTAITGSAPSFADVTINNSLVSFDAGSSVSISSLAMSGTVTMTAATLALNGLVVTSTMNLTAATLALNGTALEVMNGSVLNLTAQAITGGSLQVDGGGTFEQVNTQQLNFSSATVLSGGVVTHAANGTTRAAVVNFILST